MSGKVRITTLACLVWGLKKKIRKDNYSTGNLSPQNTHISDCIRVLAKPEGGLGHACNASVKKNAVV